MRKHRTVAWKRSGLVWSGLVVALSFMGCGGLETDTTDEPTMLQQGISGVYEVDDGSTRPISHAESLTNQHGANGAIAKITTPRDRLCSGVLVSRRHVLTAGHCTIGPSSGKIKVTFAQEPDEVFEEIGRQVWSTLGPGEGGGGKDVALITLDRPVPTTIVEKIPKVNSGDAGAFLRRNRSSTYMIGGHGRHLAGQDPDERRRYGSVNKVESWLLECSWYSIPELTCLPFPELWVSGNGGAIGEGGDSGGPLFGKDKDTGEYVVVGIRSGYRWWKSDPTGRAKQVYAPIGKLGKGGVKVAHLLGPDADDDGVPDELDNCKPSFCMEHDLPMERCVNPNQEDDDGDGIGEACDNCPQSRCDRIGDGRSCQNVRQLDFDNDGVGDICDPCPTVAAPEDHAPIGPVGKACGCEGMDHLAFIECVPHSTTCEEARAGTCLYDFAADTTVVGGLCSRLTDSDGDTIPDECDSCTHERDINNLNSNRHIEYDVGALALGDVCDPVPLFPFTQGKLPEYGKYFEPIPGSGQEGVDIERLEGYAWLGIDSTRQYTSFEQPLVFRHCSCFLEDGGWLDEEECARQQCFPSDADLLLGGWRVASFAETWSGPAVPDGKLPVYFESYRPSSEEPKELEPVKPPTRTLFWQTFDDITRVDDPIDARLTNIGTLVDNYETHGLLASVVLRDGGEYASLRDAQPEALRTTVKLMMTPRYTKDELVIIAQRCPFSFCLGWLPGAESRINPDPTKMWEMGPVFFTDIEGGLLKRDGVFSDVSRRLSTKVSALMRTGEWAWVPRLDDPSMITRTGTDRVGVLVPREGTLFLSPLLLVEREGEISFDGDPEQAASVEDMVGAVQMGPEEKALYSAAEDRLFIVGMDRGWRTFTVTTDELQTGGFDHAPSATVLGFTYAPVSNRMFTLEVQDISEGAQTATIFVHNLHDGKVAPLWTVPYYGGFSKVSIAADRSGAIVLMGSTNETFSAWRFKLQNDALELQGSLDLPGAMVDEPHHGVVAVPLLHEDQASWIQLNASSFKGERLIEAL